MKLETGKHIGRDVGEVPTEYLEWAMGHLTMSDAVEGAVMSEYARRAGEARVEAMTPADRLKERVSETLTKFAARHGL